MSLPDLTREQLDTLAIDRDRPLLVVDADEVLVHFLRHFRDYVDNRGWRLDLSDYRLDKALIRQGGEETASRDEGLALIDAFFDAEVSRQQMIPGAAEALRSLSRLSQVVILTNLPHPARAGRVANLSGHGLDYPVVTNRGGKGHALSELAARTDRAVAFVDDSAVQIESVARHAPAVRRVQLIGCDWAAPALPRAPSAELFASTWGDAVPWLTEALDAPAGVRGRG
ncbi:hypothetical protein [Roseobacter sp. HKCCA0434]|uniref:hypothetical protein n=1 Tax=Roseobacter sp. HKCCA0434 TaxID=3079297 RepID=UPI0029058BD6|nr:hypothetical protein [Roseobacter sp. HKCCA0434]